MFIFGVSAPSRHPSRMPKAVIHGVPDFRMEEMSTGMDGCNAKRMLLTPVPEGASQHRLEYQGICYRAQFTANSLQGVLGSS